MKGNVDNLVTLCLDWIDCDSLAFNTGSRRVSAGWKRKR